jgi:hypothetical protein
VAASHSSQKIAVIEDIRRTVAPRPSPHARRASSPVRTID